MTRTSEDIKKRTPTIYSVTKEAFRWVKRSPLCWMKKDIPAVRKFIALTLPALGLTLSIYAVTAIFEPDSNLTCKSPAFSWDFFVCKSAHSKLLGQVQNFSILLALSIFILDTRDRRKHSERVAWQLIDGARGTETSGARIQALEEINQAGGSLRGLDADGADLIEIDLRKADLARSSLKCALLQGANLYKANLYIAQLQQANLRGANLEGSNLWGADLEEANLDTSEPDDIEGRDTRFDRKPAERLTNLRNAKLGRANLQRAILPKADLQGADLRGAFLQGANLRGACLKDADLEGAHLSRAQITIEQLQLSRAESWRQAKYDVDFCQKHRVLNLIVDDYAETTSATKTVDSPELKLLGIVHTLLTTEEAKRKQEITEIRQKITELIRLLDSDLLSSSPSHPLINEVVGAVEKLSLENKDIDNTARDLLLDIEDKVKARDQAYREADELERQAHAKNQQLELSKRCACEAGDWLKKNRETVRTQALEQYWINCSGGEISDPSTASRHLESDMDTLLSHLADCLCQFQKPCYEELALDLPALSYVEVLKAMSETTIPNILGRSSNALSKEGILYEFIRLSICQLQESD